MDIKNTLMTEFKIAQTQVDNVVELIDQDNTIPFIARYRKEQTGSLDDQILREIYDRLIYLRSLEKRMAEVIASIDGQEKLTDELATKINNAITLAEVEDLYRPYKLKRKTRASVAKERGLEPLAITILEQNNATDPFALASDYINDDVPTAEDAINGAKDIIAEQASDSANVRKRLRYFIFTNGSICTKAVDAEAESIYKMYYDYSEPFNKLPSHRILAINRAEKDDAIKVTTITDKIRCCSLVHQEFKPSSNACGELITQACDDSFERLLFPSIERDIRTSLFETASESAIKVFAKNLRQLLMQPPIKGTVTLGLDPAYRTGCKIAVVDDTGKVLDTTVVYPTPPQSKVEAATTTLVGLIKKHKVQTIAIGNGTASRESEKFVADMIKLNNLDVQYIVVSEAGASVYSASKLASEEFPQYDVSLRSAVSIARRLQDPLAELVKIDPRAVGVGQYQHDMPKKRLDEALTGVVESCVNQVGVNLNTASHSLLSKISGVSPAVAKNIVAYREEKGKFSSRKELLKVAKLGPKAFEQCAGFLRVSGSKEFLDSTAVHPESYPVAKQLIDICGYSKDDLKNGNFIDITDRLNSVATDKVAEQLGVGTVTVIDIASELAKPNRDPRDQLVKPLLRSDVLELKDVKSGMELTGTVRNIIDFGAFVDIGVHDDGLVHISQICDRYIKHPLEVLKIGDIVTVWVLDVDVARKRISLTMKKPPEIKD